MIPTFPPLVTGEPEDRDFFNRNNLIFVLRTKKAGAFSMLEQVIS
jgi:hypothetical protein